MILDKMRTSNQPIGFNVVAKLTMSQYNQAVSKLLAKNLSAVREPFEKLFGGFFL